MYCSDYVTGLAWEPLHTCGPDSGAGSGTGKGRFAEYLASASKDKTVRVWNTRTRATAFVLSGHADAVEGTLLHHPRSLFGVAHSRIYLYMRVQLCGGVARASSIPPRGIERYSCGLSSLIAGVIT